MIRLITFAIIFTSISLNSTAQGMSPQPSGEKLPDGPGKQIVERACVSCHSVHVIVSKRASADDWADEVDKMIGRGAVLSDEETDQVVDYLATHFGPANAKSGDSDGKASADRPAPGQPSSAEKTAPKISSGAASIPGTALLDVNKATVQELESSLGLTEIEARGVVHYREQNGSFKTWQEVSSVPGVPMDKIRDNEKRLVF